MGTDRTADAMRGDCRATAIGGLPRDHECDPLSGSLGMRVAHVATQLSALADRILVVPALRAAPAVPVDP
jgi:hypothetical protein